MAWEDEEFVLVLPGKKMPEAPVAVEVKKVVEVKVEQAVMWEDGLPAAAGGGGGDSWEDEAQEYAEEKAAAKAAAVAAAIAWAEKIAREKAADEARAKAVEQTYKHARWVVKRQLNKEIATKSRLNNN